MYSWLDVYKRQGSSLMSGNENKVVINLSSECLKKMANDPEFAKKVEFNLTGAVPVSYTHLDVYKRQRYSFQY